MSSDSIFNWPKRVTYGSFLFLCKTFFLFLPFLDMHAQIRNPQNWYTDCKLALDQPLESQHFPRKWLMVETSYIYIYIYTYILHIYIYIYIRLHVEILCVCSMLK